jgi:hypothetical protein
MNRLRRALVRLLGRGRFPGDFRQRLVAEGLLVLAEELSGSVDYHRYRRPGFAADARGVRVTGAIAVTERRLVVWVDRAKLIDLPHRHAQRPALEVTRPGEDTVRFALTAETFRADSSGEIVLRLRTPYAARIGELLIR